MENKKGALELSINAIVIIVIAITVLGLSLVFVRQMFAQTTETTFSVMKGTDLTKLVNPPSRDNPLTVTPASLEIRNTKEKIVGVAFINTEPSDANFALSVEYDCTATRCEACVPTCEYNGGDEADADSRRVRFIYNGGSMSLKPDEIGYWKIAVNPVFNKGVSTIIPMTGSEVRIMTVKVTITDADGAPILDAAGNVNSKKADIVLTVSS